MFTTLLSGPHRWRSAALAALLGLAAPLGAMAQQGLWADDSQVPAGASRTLEHLRHYRAVKADLASLRAALQAAPAEQYRFTSGVVIALPMPDGGTERFRVSQVPVMAPGLAAKFPEIQTYQAQGIDNPSALARLDVTPRGFHAMVMAPNERSYYIDPAGSSNDHYLAFFNRDMSQAGRGWTCQLAPGSSTTSLPSVSALARISNGTQLKTYRLAVACTPQYAAAVTTQRGIPLNLMNVMAAMVASVNRVSGVYEKEVAVRLQMVSNNDQLVFFNGGPNTANPTYTDANGNNMLGQNQTNVDRIIGPANYDIGHVFSTGGGGIAQRPSVCINGGKARGVTGLPQPYGDAYDIDFVAHEMGHQFNGNHTFNSVQGNCSGGTRAAIAAYEPGSGTTIMAYAGICSPEDIQQHSDPYFHSYSFDEILTHINANATGGSGAGAGCAAITPTGNAIPVPNAGQNYVIPKSTPFMLTGSATDANNDPLTYSWEQFNLGPGSGVNTPTGDAPIFRVFEPKTTPTRIFPQISDIVNNTQTMGERLPSYARTLNFRFVARDNRTGGGGVDYAAMQVDVAGTAGPFLVMQPNTSNIVWQAGAPAQVSWDVANTTAAPINAANVDILLSTDGGYTYPTVLLANTPNDGFENITVPATQPATSTARVMVRAAGNVFFDISNANFSIQATTAPTFFLSTTAATNNQPLTVCAGASTSTTVNVGQLQGFTGNVTLGSSNAPAGITLTYGAASVAAGANTQVTVNVAAGTPAGTYTILLTGVSGGTTQTQNLVVTVQPTATATATAISPNPTTVAALRPRFNWSAVAGATSYTIEVSTDPNFAAGTIVATYTNVTGTSYFPTTPLPTTSTLYWRVRGVSPCNTAPFSAAASFQTTGQTCAATASTQIPRTILNAAQSSVTSTLSLNASGRVGELRITNLTLTHPDISELEITLTPPSGTAITLLPRGTCPGTANLNVSFDDLGAALTCGALNSGTAIRAASPLVGLTTGSVNGTWTLTVTDYVAGNGGRLLTWGIEACTVNQPPTPSTALLANYLGYTGGAGQIEVLWAGQDNTATSYELQSQFNTNSGTWSPVATIPNNPASPTTSFVHNVFNNGRYYYRVRGCNANGCSPWSNETNALSTQAARAQQAGVSVAPNPSTGLFELNLDNAQRGPVALSITDALGRTVYQQTLTKGSAALRQSLDLSALSPGVYQLHLAMPEGNAVVRLLKQ